MKERSDGVQKKKKESDEDWPNKNPFDDPPYHPPYHLLSDTEDKDRESEVSTGYYNATRTPKDLRREEFEDFEHKLKECLCKSAVKTKFHPLTLEGVDVTRDINQMMDAILERISTRTIECENLMNDQRKYRDDTISDFKKYSESIHRRINKFREDIEKDLSNEITDAIHHLQDLVDSFPIAFQDQPPEYVKYYKQELQEHIQNGMESSNLKIRCSSILLESVEHFRKLMHEEIFEIVPETSQLLCTSMSYTNIIKPSPVHPLPISYECEIPNIFKRFQEDISFRFSLGWRTIIGNYLMPRNTRLALLLGAHPYGYEGIIKKWKSTRLALECSTSRAGQSLPLCSHAVLPRMNSLQVKSYLDKKEGDIVPATYSLFETNTIDEVDEDAICAAFSDWFEKDTSTVKAVQRIATLSVIHGAVHAALLLGITWRSGLKALALGTLGYGSLYLFERATWNNNAKEKEFKKQLVEHTTAELHRIAALKAKQSSRQIRHDMTKTFKKISDQVCGTQREFEAEMKKLTDELKRLDIIAANIKVFKSKSSRMRKQLVEYSKQYNIIE